MSVSMFNGVLFKCGDFSHALLKFGEHGFDIRIGELGLVAIGLEDGAFGACDSCFWHAIFLPLSPKFRHVSVSRGMIRVLLAVFRGARGQPSVLKLDRPTSVARWDAEVPGEHRLAWKRVRIGGVGGLFGVGESVYITARTLPAPLQLHHLGISALVV